MKKMFTKLQLAILLIMSVMSAQAQFTSSDIKYWIGTGADTAILVVDFQDTLVFAGGYDTIASSYAWGFLFDATNNVTAADMLALIDVDDSNLKIDAGQFLNDIIYDEHSGIAGTPNYFSTFTKTASTSWVTNAGIGDTLTAGMWFGCSYTGWPADAPKMPISALNPNYFSATDVTYWIGTGSDTAFLTIDFLDNSFVPSTTWGYLYSGMETMEDMLVNIAAADVNLTINTGGFLNDITYGNHTGIGGNPAYWNIFEGNHLSTYHSSVGLSASLSNGKWFGCSYDINYPAAAPFRTVPALNPTLFTTEEVEFWTGTGTDSAVFIADFQGNGSAYAWGVLFNDSISGEAIITTIAAADTIFSANLAGGFLNDLIFGNDTGKGGQPNYWSTWTGTNTGDWYSNLGLGTQIMNKQWLGCSYTDFNPALRPNAPVAAPIPAVVLGIANNNEKSELKAYPNPTVGILNFNTTVSVAVYDLTGRLVAQGNNINQLDISNLPASLYVVQLQHNDKIEVLKITKQ